MSDPRRNLPSVDSLLAGPGVAALLATHPRALVLKAARAAVDAARLSGGSAPSEGWDEAVRVAVRRLAEPSLALPAHRRREIIPCAKSLIAARIPHALLVFISFLRALDALPTDEVAAHLTRLTMTPAVPCKRGLHVSCWPAAKPQAAQPASPR